MNTKDFDTLIESICSKGCLDVNQTIALLEKGESPIDLQHLNSIDHQAILKELKSIMDVYGGEACSL